MPQTVFVGEYSDIVLEEDDNYASTNTRHSSAGNIVLFKHNNFFTDRGRTGTRTVKTHDFLILKHSL